MKKRIEETVNRVRGLLPFIEDEDTKKNAVALLALASQCLPTMTDDNINNYPSINELLECLDVIDKIYFEKVSN